MDQRFDRIEERFDATIRAVAEIIKESKLS
jgi:hypothetical protein